MKKTSPLEYFLGANSRYGFRSLYGGFCPPEEGCFLYVIKGGPGCGKSSFMRRIASAAEENGLEVERVLCSGDPDSLDGVYIPALKLGYVDGTAPHVIEAACPGACSAYLDLGRFLDISALRPLAGRIMDIDRRCSQLYSLAYSRIAAGAALLPREHPGLWGAREREKISKKVASFARREFSAAHGRGKRRDCFMGAVSCRGLISASSAIYRRWERLIYLDNLLGMGHIYLEKLLSAALEAGLEVLVCRDCLQPELIEALVFPELSLALCCGSGGEAEKGCRHIRLDSLANRELLSRSRPDLRRSARLSRDCLSLAVDTLAQAKSLHDELEALYNPFVDFDGLYAESTRHIDLLF